MDIGADRAHDAKAMAIGATLKRSKEHIMAKPTSTATWQTLDPATLPAAISKQYDRYKEAYVEMKAERVAFETALAVAIDVPKGQRVIFGYNFGKLSVAIVADDAKPAAKGSLSLSSFLASQAANGRRS